MLDMFWSLGWCQSTKDDNLICMLTYQSITRHDLTISSAQPHSDKMWYIVVSAGGSFLNNFRISKQHKESHAFPFQHCPCVHVLFPGTKLVYYFLLKYTNATYCNSIKIHWLCLTSFSNMSRSNSFQPDRDTGCDPVRLWHNQIVGRIEEVNLKKNETQSCFRLSSHSKTLIPLAKRQGMCGVVYTQLWLLLLCQELTWGQKQ